MASSPREFFSELADSVVAKASALLVSVRKASLQPTELLSVERACSEMDHATYQGQKRAAQTLALVKALRMAHGEARDPVLWPTPEEEQEERRRAKRSVATATTVAMTTTVGVAAPTFSAVGVTTVAEAEEARLGLVVALDAAKGVASAEATGAVAAALGAAMVDGGTAREAVQTGTARRPRSARLRPRARKTAR